MTVAALKLKPHRKKMVGAETAGSAPTISLCVLDQLPVHGFAVVRRHPIATGNRRSG